MCAVFEEQTSEILAVELEVWHTLMKPQCTCDAIAQQCFLIVAMWMASVRNKYNTTALLMHKAQYSTIKLQRLNFSIQDLATDILF